MIKLFRYVFHGLFFIPLFYSCKQYPTLKDRAIFELSMAKALHLTFVNRDEEYNNTYFNIFNDTIVGLNLHAPEKSKYSEYYFAQSIKNLKYKFETDNDSLRFPSISNIDNYKNGSFYFCRFGGGTMQSLDSTGKLTEYFRKYDHDVSYANKAMFYKDKVVIAGMYGVYIFDKTSEKMLWKYVYIDDPNDGMSTVINNKLVFTETARDTIKRSTNTNIVCVDLDRLKVKWQKILNHSATYTYFQQYLPYHHLYTDDGEVIIPQTDTCYALNLNTGKVKGKLRWKGYFRYEPRFNVENHKIYLENNFTLLCADLISGKKIWEVKNAGYWELYKNHVIAFTPD
jgi:outer membrane protein assembly factor BamB